MIANQFRYDPVLGMQFFSKSSLDKKQEELTEKLNSTKRRRAVRFSTRTLAKPMAIGKIKPKE